MEIFLFTSIRKHKERGKKKGISSTGIIYMILSNNKTRESQKVNIDIQTHRDFPVDMIPSDKPDKENRSPASAPQPGHWPGSQARRKLHFSVPKPCPHQDPKV